MLHKPLEQHQWWLANFSLHPMEMMCKKPRAVLAGQHEHAFESGTVLLSRGYWTHTGELTSQYPAVGASLYAKAVAAALARLKPKDRFVGTQSPLGILLDKEHSKRQSTGSSGTRRICAGESWTERRGTVRYPQYTITQGQAALIERPPTAGPEGKLSFEQDEQKLVPQGLAGQETEKEKQAREDELNRDSEQAVKDWRAKAEKKQWDTVTADLSVYAYSGQKVTKDPRTTEEYKTQVIADLGFDEATWKEKHPELTHEEVLAAREVFWRKAAAFWVDGTPRTTVRFVLHDTVPTGPPVRLPPHNLKGEAAEWVDGKLEER